MQDLLKGNDQEGKYKRNRHGCIYKQQSQDQWCMHKNKTSNVQVGEKVSIRLSLKFTKDRWTRRWCIWMKPRSNGEKG